MKNTGLSQSENEIMELIWDCKKEWISIPEIFQALSEEQWKYTTIATFVTRLKEKGFLKLSKIGSMNLYSPVISKDEYLNMKTQEFLKLMHKGSVKSLMASLYSNRLSEDDYKQLIELIEKCEE